MFPDRWHDSSPVSLSWQRQQQQIFSSKVLTLLVWYNNNNNAYITSTAMDDCPQPPPPNDAPNAGDPTPRTLRLGYFIIEGVDRFSEEEELSDHAIVFYNELITLMNAIVRGSPRHSPSK